MSYIFIYENIHILNSYLIHIGAFDSDSYLVLAFTQNKSYQMNEQNIEATLKYLHSRRLFFF